MSKTKGIFYGGMGVPSKDDSYCKITSEKYNMNNKLIAQVKKEVADKAELIEKENIRKMLALIEAKGGVIKNLQGQKAQLEKMLEAGNYRELEPESNQIYDIRVPATTGTKADYLPYIEAIWTSPTSGTSGIGPHGTIMSKA